MIVVSLTGVNFIFSSRLGCSGQNTIIFSRNGLFYGGTRRSIKKRVLIGVPNSQLTTIFSAIYQLTAIFWPSQLTTNFG